MRKEIIKELFSQMMDANISCALIGSTNLWLQGMHITPHDIDIVVGKEELEHVKELFDKHNHSHVHSIRPLSKEPIWELNFHVRGMEVQIIGELETGDYVSKLRNPKDIITIDVLKCPVPCFTLEAEARAYEATRRERKAKQIRKFLEEK